MAGYVSVNEASAAVRIPEFRGLWQYGDGVDSDPRYASECVNALTTQGVLRPMAACEQLTDELADPIETLARLHRRYYTAGSQKDVIIAAAGGQLYWRTPEGERWSRIPMPPEIVEEEYQSSRWSCVSYEMNPEGSEAPVDVLLLSNEKDGMICVRGDDLTAFAVHTPKKFGVIARHAERIWGGAITDDPDMLAYSAPYNPFDWEANSEIPEDGAGDVLQPSWDGDSFAALASFGSQLVAFKRSRVWRVLGTHPGEYAFKEQYGGGAPCAHTIAVDGARILMLGRDGLWQYDGERTSPYGQEYAQAVFERVNQEALGKACACLWHNAYYCALPLDGSKVNNAVLIYHTVEKSWLLREGISVGAFLPMEDELFFTSARRPGSLWRWREDSCLTGTAVPMRWVGPWLEAGCKNRIKSGFVLYLTVECDAEVRLKIGLENEKKRRLKQVTFAPPIKGSHARQRRLVLEGKGRRFRLVVESDGTVPWRMIGGILLEMETESD